MPNSSGAETSSSGATALIRSSSNELARTRFVPFRSTYRNGSGIAIGTSCRISGERSESA